MMVNLFPSKDIKTPKKKAASFWPQIQNLLAWYSEGAGLQTSHKGLQLRIKCKASSHWNCWVEPGPMNSSPLGVCTVQMFILLLQLEQQSDFQGNQGQQNKTGRKKIKF